jgi:hypothetical protein
MSLVIGSTYNSPNTYNGAGENELTREELNVNTLGLFAVGNQDEVLTLTDFDVSVGAAGYMDLIRINKQTGIETVVRRFRWATGDRVISQVAGKRYKASIDQAFYLIVKFDGVVTSYITINATVEAYNRNVALGMLEKERAEKGINLNRLA